jgi:hypothetical protein
MEYSSPSKSAGKEPASAVALGMRLRLAWGQLIGSLQISDRLARAAQRMIIDTWTNSREGPVDRPVLNAARLDPDLIDLFEAWALL